MSDSLILDVSDWSIIDLTGPDARSFLHSFCTNDINRLAPGQGCEAFITNIKGRIVGHVFVCALSDFVRLLAVPGASEAVVPHLSKYLIGVETEIVDRTGDMHALLAAGSAAEELLHDIIGSAPPTDMSAHLTFEMNDASYWMARLPVTGAPTFLVSGADDAIEQLRETLTSRGVRPGTGADLEPLRIAAGFPWHGRDLTEENIAQEAGRTKSAISFEKGCYLGQEPIARLDAMGHTNQELRGLLVTGIDHIPSDARVFTGETDVGTITSAAHSSAHDGVVALAIIKTAQATPGTELEIDVSGQRVPATVFWPSLTQ